MDTETDAQITFELNTKWGEVLEGVGGGWTAIPNVLLRKQYELQLSATELNVLLNLIRFWWIAEKAPFPSPEKMAKEMGVTPRTVYRNLASLESKGFIQRQERIGKATSYALKGLVEKLTELKQEQAV